MAGTSERGRSTTDSRTSAWRRARPIDGTRAARHAWPRFRTLVRLRFHPLGMPAACATCWPDTRPISLGAGVFNFSRQHLRVARDRFGFAQALLDGQMAHTHSQPREGSVMSRPARSARMPLACSIMMRLLWLVELVDQDVGRGRRRSAGGCRWWRRRPTLGRRRVDVLQHTLVGPE